MLKDKHLMRLCLVMALLGLTALFFVSQLKHDTEIGSITKMSVGNVVTITGVSANVTERNKNFFFTLSDTTGEVRVVFFQSRNYDDTYIRNGQNVTVTGKVELYRGELEIIANSVKIN